MSDLTPIATQTTNVRMKTNTQRARLMVTDSAGILKRLYLIQRELVLAQAGWMPGTAHWESKLLLPETLWQDALVARELRQRVLELRYPERTIDAGGDAPVIALVRAFRDAPDGPSYIAALRSMIKPWLRNGYVRYLELMDPLDDAPTTRILRQAISDIDDQLVLWERAAGPLATADAAYAQALAAGLGDPLADDGERTLPATVTPFAIARKGARDSRFAPVRYYWPDALDRGFGAGTGLQLQVRAAVHHINEVWAAEMAAASLFDLAEQADAEFLFDGARWCYDEIRHCRMGYTRLREWGFSDGEMPLGSFQYDAGARCDALTRLGIIFFFESTYIHTKPERSKILGAWGDRVSSHDLDFDWADEQIHTHYGNRWLKYFLEQAGDPRKPMEVRGDAEAAVRAEQLDASATDRNTLEDTFYRMMRKAEAMATEADAS